MRSGTIRIIWQVTYEILSYARKFGMQAWEFVISYHPLFACLSLLFSRWQVRRANKLTVGTDGASGRQQIGGTMRPQNARMPLNGCNSELTTRWLASACCRCRSCDRLASQLARKREGEGCTRPAKGGKLISTALAHEVVHTEKKRQRYLEYPAPEKLAEENRQASSTNCRQFRESIQ